MNGNGTKSQCIPRRPAKSSGHVVSSRFLVISIGLGTMVTMGFLFYVSVVTSPTLLNRMAKICPEMNNHSAHVDGMFKLEAFPRQEEEYEKVQPPRPLNILIGIMTMAKKTERRHLLRMAYRAQSTEIAHVDVKFVIGKLKDATEKTLVGLENLVYHDILELDCEENMNHGKTFTFFSSAAAAESGAENRKGGPSYQYVMKTDDDSYVRIDNLAKHLLPLPRTDLYYGYVLPCENQDPYKWYMAGMGYVISWDLVEWIRNSTIPRDNIDGTEDQLVGKWFDKGGKAKNRVNDKPLFYDHPAFKGNCAHELIPETVLIHQVKTLERWADVLSFFENTRLHK